MMMQILFALFLILHGLVHLLWFVVPWQMTNVDGLPYRPTILSGQLDVREVGITAVFILGNQVQLSFLPFP